MPSWMMVYFTDPNPPDQVSNGIDRYMTPTLKGAKKSIDVTSFDLNLPSVVNALVDAKKRGVAVRVVVDETNGTQTLKASDSASGQDEDTLKAFKDAGIPVVDGGRSNGLMHNNIILVDGATLFMGSWNVSYNDTFRNNNNLLKITDKTLIANYQAKFNELFVDKRFGTKARVGAQTPQTTIDGVPVANYFSPVDKVIEKLVARVNGAQRSIKFMAFTYTQKDLANAMIARPKAGAQAQGVIENRGASQGAAPALYCAKVSAKLDGNKYTMHHKVIILDDKTVITGSFNFTQTADDANDDNVLIIDSPAVASLYEREFATEYGQAKDQSGVDCAKAA
jgi:phosphatidylserine/phosphatidylglycerophosphate/cardiolipin synthase-like enzyme